MINIVTWKNLAEMQIYKMWILQWIISIAWIWKSQNCMQNKTKIYTEKDTWQEK